MIEALCTRCNEIFLPHTVMMDDLIHGETYRGTPCGGIGVIQGQWILDLGTPPIDRTLGQTRAVLQQEAHGKAEPNCDDPHCVWHFPMEISA